LNGYLDFVRRLTYFQVAYASAPVMVIRSIDTESKYPFTFRYSNGDLMHGSKTYKLYTPPNPPAALFWAATAYNITDGTMTEAPQLLPSIHSMNKIAKNERRLLLTPIGSRLSRAANP
jgi:hypothetical protein